ncbi:hypothetical protein O3P69_010077 [Scylla paramamosain]|uniref:Uncharacterized protein n=1 Tax=Scylla paramamosain TaxID=85552 RepID=A0AAW0SNG2_SCYPA
MTKEEEEEAVKEAAKEEEEEDTGAAEQFKFLLKCSTSSPRPKHRTSRASPQHGARYTAFMLHQSPHHSLQVLKSCVM